MAAKYPDRCFFVSCDLDPSTKLGKATALVPKTHHFEMSIEEQAASLMADGLAYSSREPQINVFATFAAFFEGIAREGFEMWRYQRNLTGFNEGLNVIMHLSHVGACTGRDHFSGWSLDWINLALGYMPFLRRFYAPADARAAFVAVRDAAAGYGGHIVAIPRDNLPVLTRDDGKTPLWNAGDAWTAVTPYRERKGARAAILAIGAPSFLAGAASDRLAEQGTPVDVYVINGFPVDEAFFNSLPGKYGRIVTIEDGLIGTVDAGLRGFAAHVAGRFAGCGLTLDHFGIVDPQIAPSDHYLQVWEHYGMTADALVERIRRTRERDRPAAARNVDEHVVPDREPQLHLMFGPRHPDPVPVEVERSRRHVGVGVRLRVRQPVGVRDDHVHLPRVVRRRARVDRPAVQDEGAHRDPVDKDRRAGLESAAGDLQGRAAAGRSRVGGEDADDRRRRSLGGRGRVRGGPLRARKPAEAVVLSAKAAKAAMTVRERSRVVIGFTWR